MAAYKVLRPIECNHKLFLASTLAAEEIPEAAASASSGREVPVDTGGAIEIAERAAASFTLGQIEILKVQKEPATGEAVIEPQGEINGKSFH
ncbi:MAG: hypothetical protein ACRD3T_06465 [Terriglobia bacterium]